MGKCETCKFAHVNWLKGEPYRQSTYAGTTVHIREMTSVQCRIHPPVVTTIEDRNDGWPWITGDDWCGEYQPKEQNDDSSSTS